MLNDSFIKSAAQRLKLQSHGEWRLLNEASGRDLDLKIESTIVGALEV
jgi:hypothetical protein